MMILNTVLQLDRTSIGFDFIRSKATCPTIKDFVKREAGAAGRRPRRAASHPISPSKSEARTAVLVSLYISWRILLRSRISSPDQGAYGRSASVSHIDVIVQRCPGSLCGDRSWAEPETNLR